MVVTHGTLSQYCNRGELNLNVYCLVYCTEGLHVSSHASPTHCELYLIVVLLYRRFAC